MAEDLAGESTELGEMTYQLLKLIDRVTKVDFMMN